MTCTGPATSCHAVTGLLLHLDLLEIQQQDLEFVSLSSHHDGLLGQGPALLADVCLSGRATAYYLFIRCARVPQSKARSEVCNVCYVHPPDGRPLASLEILGSTGLESCQICLFYVNVWACSHVSCSRC
jgi:hypothetical protein